MWQKCNMDVMVYTIFDAQYACRGKDLIVYAMIVDAMPAAGLIGKSLHQIFH
jgi:hypothetical protein